MKRKMEVRALVTCGILIAIAVLLRSFSIMVPIGGAGAMRIGFAGVFIKLPAILFGATIGGMVSGTVDILAHLIYPKGAYIPFLTITSIISGILTGLIWNKVKDMDVRKIEKSYPIFFAILGVVTVIIHMIIIFSSKSSLIKIKSAFEKKYLFSLISIEVIVVLAFIVFVLNIKLKNNNILKNIYENYMKIIITIGIPRIITTTINTFILLMFIPALQGKNFMFLWVPRVVESIFMIVFESYLISLLLSAYKSMNFVITK
ncbi:ECF transporter S component [Clostridium niameyense]|uniref:ECF transporter S component n=1 Tax=Clostridium niameyense TaxID=1622073 RepID=UPI00067F05E2|nr:ECF transporter S component [Clostridium niameyense]